MVTPLSRRSRPAGVRAGAALTVAGALVLASLATGAYGSTGRSGGAHPSLRAVSFHGYRVDVPMRWRVVDLRTQTHACLRFDRPVIFLGHAGDQRACPSHVVGGAPGLHLEALDARSLHELAGPARTVPPSDDVANTRLPSHGPVSEAVEGAGVLLTLVYGESSTRLVRGVMSSSRVLASARSALVSSFPTAQTANAAGASVPGSYLGKGFDACTAPSQAAMDAWRSLSDYASVGVYVGGVSRGCAQPNLTPSWVSHQVSKGWHLVPTYVGRQAPCTGFQNRMSYDASTAAAQGEAEAADAVARADALGIAAPSTLYADVEGYDNTKPGCVTAVLNYLSGWTNMLHRHAYEAGVYSSASSGIHDLSTHYDSSAYHRSDDIWIAWWNYQADVAGGSYVPDSQWSEHQRVHQYVGNATESHGGYTIQIDRNYLDVSSSVPPPRGCPTNLDFASYRVLTTGNHGAEVVAAQCLLARAGFSPGVATGTFGWRTAAAVRAFKAAVALASDDSVIRRWAWTALASAGPTRFLEHGSRGPRVRKVQRALTARLQRTVAISGAYDSGTAKAVTAYQRVAHIGVTGTVGPVTWTALHAGL